MAISKKKWSAERIKDRTKRAYAIAHGGEKCCICGVRLDRQASGWAGPFNVTCRQLTDGTHACFNTIRCVARRDAKA